MIELKVHCDCGQKFKFDVEPVNNQMPFTVACPICKRDGTAKANTMLQQMVVFKPVGSAPAASSPPTLSLASAAPSPASPAPAPAPVAPVAPPPPSPGPSKLRINAVAHAETAAATPSVPVSESTPPPIGARPRMGMGAPAAAEESGKPPSFGLGLLGGLLGALVGAILYYIIFKTTGVRSFLALGVGALAGLGANFLGRGEGSKELGGITAVFVVMGVLGAQYLVILGIWNGIVREAEDAGYSDRVKESQAIVKAIPTGSDEEIRMYLARQEADPGEVAKPASVPEDEVKSFKEKDLPEARDFVSGKITKEQYQTQEGMDPEKMKKFMNEEGNTFKAVFILYCLNLRSIISLALGVGIAFKLSTNARGD